MMKSYTSVANWILYLLMMGGATASIANTLEPSQLLSLMEASRSRYQTMEAIIEVREYEWKDRPDGETRLIASQNITIRRSPQRIFVSEEGKLYLEDSQHPTYQKEILAGSSNLWKQYLQVKEASRSDEKTGSISNKPPTGQHLGVFESVWGLGGYGERNWNKIGKMITTKGKLSTEDNLIRLETPTKESDDSPWLIVWIDPQKQYVPVRHSILYSDKKTIFMTQTAGDWTEMKSVWVPLSYNRNIYPIKSRQDYTVLSIKIDESIPPSDWDFQFPVGTIVDNKILNVRYEVRDSKIQPPNVYSEGLSGDASFFSDQQLSDAVTKIRDLPLVKNPVASGEQQKVSFAREYHWVLPGKNTYALELIPDTKTNPALFGKTVSDSPLILHSVDDQLASSGKIIVTLERPAGHKAFADAVLTLDFGGVKTPIHFVAAPLP